MSVELGIWPGDWVADARCRNHPRPDLWFPGSEDGTGIGGGDNGAAARRICRECHVRDDCLEHALTAPESFGVWGGTSERERRRVRRERAKAKRVAA